MKGLEILHQERRGQVRTMVIEHFNGILFRKSRPTNKQHIDHSVQFYCIYHPVLFIIIIIIIIIIVDSSSQFIFSFFFSLIMNMIFLF